MTLRQNMAAYCATMISCFIFVGCFVVDVLPTNTDTDKTPSTSRPVEVPPPAPAPAEPALLDDARWLRRVALDLMHRLPEPTDVAAVTAGTTSVQNLATQYLATSEAARAMAATQTSLWGMDTLSTPDLTRFGNASDTNLTTAPTDDERANILSGVTQTLRYQFEIGRSFPEMFATEDVIAHTDALTLWGQSSAGTPWPGEPYRFLNYDDSRPRASLLADLGFLAAFDSGGQDTPTLRTAKILRRLQCLPMEDHYAHLFYTLTSTQLAGNVNSLASGLYPCQSCHGQFTTAASLYAGLGTGDSFANWRSYSGDDTITGHHAGFAFTGMTEWATYIGLDPRTHQCSIKGFFGRFLQRSISTLDQEDLLAAINEFDNGGFHLQDALARIITSKSYRHGTLAGELSPVYLWEASGVRVLNAQQWAGIAKQIAYGDVTVPPELSPGYEEASTGPLSVPTGNYWHHLDRFARQLATVIVADELADSRLAESRLLLTQLPNGSGAGASAAVVLAQMRDLWVRLSAIDGEIADVVAAQYQALHTAALDGRTTATAHREAWRTVFVALFTHPDVITY